MKRLIAILLFLPLLAAAAGPHPAVKATQGNNYDRLPAGFKVYVTPGAYADGCTGGDGQAGNTSIDTAGNGGAGSGNIYAQTNVAGINMGVRWVCNESSLGVYSDTALNTIIDQVAAHGGKFGFYLVSRSYTNGSTHSNMPSYIYNDSGTYGGTASHGGETITSNSYAIVWGNTAVMNRFKAWIDHLVSSYGPNSSRPAQFVYLDEFSIGSGLTLANVGYADLAAIETGMEAQLAYCVNAFYPTPCGTKLSFLTGDSSPWPGVQTVLAYCRDTIAHCPFAQELAMPNPYDAKYPRPAGANITATGITTMSGLSTGFASDRVRIFNTEYATSSTWDSTYSPNDAAVFLRYIASLTTPNVASGTNVYYLVTATNGINASSGSWSGIGNLITGGFLR